MGIFDWPSRGARALQLVQSPINLGSSPFATSDLTPIVIADLLGLDVDQLPVDREIAMTIPAAAKLRNLLVSTVAKFPLVALNKDGELPGPDQPSWCYRSDNGSSPYERMALTVEDLFWTGWAIWRKTLGAEKDGRRPMLDAEYIDQKRITWPENQLRIDGLPIDESELLFFDMPGFAGMLTVARRTLRGALDTEAAWVGRMRNPIPLLELHQTDDSMDEDQVAPFVAAWSKARRSVNGAVGYTPTALELRTHGEVKTELYESGRNAIRTDVGSFANVRASMLDGTMGIDSLTYSTTEGERNSFYEFDLPMWTDPIEARLSLDDVVPRGTRIRFQKYDTPNPAPATGPVVKD